MRGYLLHYINIRQEFSALLKLLSSNISRPMTLTSKLSLNSPWSEYFYFLSPNYLQILYLVIVPRIYPNWIQITCNKKNLERNKVDAWMHLR